MFERVKLEVHFSEIGTALTVFDLTSVPFRVERLYWISNLSEKEPRGFHAHKELKQVLAVVSGSLNLKLYRGADEFDFRIRSSDNAILIPSGTWREIYALEENTTLLVAADCSYNEEDYIRNWGEYLEWYSSIARSS